jgi:hypothetical protein
MKEYFFYLDLSNREFLPYYQGQVHAIVVTTSQGVKVQFPAMHLRQFLTAAGIRGKFCLKTQNSKFFSLSRISN